MQSYAKQFDFDKAMLWGDHLRILLNSDLISPGEISETLKEKGIFIGSSEKSDTVPLLSACLLTPDEFSKLIEKSFIRESGKKYSSSSFQLSSSSMDWKTPLIDDFSSVINGIQLSNGREFASSPTLTVEPNGELKIAYTVRVLDFSKDWIQQELVYPAEIRLKESGNGFKIEVDRYRTSKDTDHLNDKITNAIGKFYKSQNITVDEKPLSIKFEDFDNTDRIRFFLQLTSSTDAEFTYKEVGDFEIIRDQEAGALPKDPQIEWMESRVSKINVNGKDLGKVFLLHEPKYYPFYFLIKMTVIYTFKFGTNVGECGIEFCFTGKSTKDNDYSGTIFNFSIEKLSRLEKNSQHAVRKKIISKVQEVRDKAFNFVLAKK
ncbi:MAG: hypothetical protein LKF82_15305 [Acinetobacter populi]|jgi:hypothetical protein|uniref:GapS4b family protein n=1 Tax=Acinetobacter populi TaxID=1582270 RepID=UPI0023548D8D|nr:hypothetical protein [Acinetobacter populi]MCH4249163.1 hypothetical protein [Acinetobacter populi]